MKKEYLPLPLDGTPVELESLNDGMFSAGTLGQGFAIRFTGTRLVSPFDGTVIAAFPTGHAFIVRRADGLEVLMHVGINSAKKPEAFSCRVKKYQQVKKGEVLTEVKPELFDADSRYCPVVFSAPQLEPILLKAGMECRALDETAVKIIF